MLCLPGLQQVFRSHFQRATLQRLPEFDLQRPLQLIFLPPQTALFRLQPAHISPNCLSLIVEGRTPLLSGPDGLLQGLPAGQLTFVLLELLLQLPPFRRRLRLTVSQLLVRLVKGGIGHIGGHPGQQLPGPLFQGCLPLACLHTLAGCLRPCRLCQSLVPLQLRLGGGCVGHLGRTGMVQGPAHRAGTSLLQGSGQDSRLSIQKGLVLPAILFLCFL